MNATETHLGADTVHEETLAVHIFMGVGTYNTDEKENIVESEKENEKKTTILLLDLRLYQKNRMSIVLTKCNTLFYCRLDIMLVSN